MLARKGSGEQLGCSQPFADSGIQPCFLAGSSFLGAAGSLGSWECPKAAEQVQPGRDHLSEAAWELAVQAEHVTTSTGVSTGMEPAPGAEASAGRLAPGTADERQREH